MSAASVQEMIFPVGRVVDATPDGGKWKIGDVRISHDPCVFCSGGVSQIRLTKTIQGIEVASCYICEACAHEYYVRRDEF